MLKVFVLPISTIFLLDIGIVQTVRYILLSFYYMIVSIPLNEILNVSVAAFLCLGPLDLFARKDL
jgi:nucleoid-associated protein YejK